MTLGDIRTRVARVSGMSASTTADTDLIDAWANEAIVQFLKETKINQKTAVLAVSANTADYTLDDDILSLDDIWIESAAGHQDILLKRVSSSDIVQMSLYEAAEDSSTMYYSLIGAHLIRFYPAPSSSSDELHILYVPRPTSSLTASSHTPATAGYGEIPAEYHPTLEAYVKWKACEAEEHKGSQFGKTFRDEWNEGLVLAKMSANRKAGVLSAPAKWGRRQHRIPSRPGIDLG